MKKYSKKNFKIRKITQTIFKILFFFSFIIVTISSILHLYEVRNKIKVFIVKPFEPFKNNYEKSKQKNDIYWAKEILNGGYILHFRHAEENKWIDGKMYDLLESDVHQNGQDKSRYAENDYFRKAVCLNKRGKVQAKAIGEHINNIGLPIGYVASSVLCRARQTSELAFGGFDSLHRILVHSGAYNEKDDARTQLLIEFYQSLNIETGKNTIVSAHNKVIKCEMFINNNCQKNPRLEQGGFYILSKSEKGLKLEYEFHNFVEFAKVFYER
jgi:phosphohistidine phosphatase SixA